MTSKASGHQVSEAVAARPEGFDADPADVAGEVVTHGTSGLKLSLDRVVANDRIVEEIEAGRYEAEELSISCDYVRPEDRVLELGAGVGFILRERKKWVNKKLEEVRNWEVSLREQVSREGAL